MLRKLVATIILAASFSAYAQLQPITASASASGPVVFPNVVVTIDRFGVSPAQITRPQGPFVLFVVNRLADHEENFTLTQKGKNLQLIGFSTHGNAHRNYIAVNPVPGDYVIHLQKHTDLTIEITITAN
jgi:hypothetical protein